MGALSKPALPPGPLRELSEALHDMHHRAGWPSLRDMARAIGCSRTTVSAAFSEPKPPRWGLLELIVETLGGDIERFHQLWLAATDRDHGPAPDRSLVPVAAVHQIPAGVATFVGRDAALAEIDRILRPSGPALPICVLSGTAGVGKTALAVQWAHHAAPRFPDGILYVDLHGYHPARPVAPLDVLAEFIRAVGTADSAMPDGLRERAAQYRSLLAARRMLLVLDNARSAEQIVDLLPGTPNCAVLVTSRDALSSVVVRHGAVRLEVDLLPRTDAVALLGALIGPRVHTEPEAAAALAGACGRLPLALRVAAEFAATRPRDSLTDLLGELCAAPRRLALLDGGDDYSAVRTVFSWSCNHLPEPTARLFRMLSLHPGPDFDAGAAAALADTDLWTVRQLMEDLARGHLVERIANGRFVMHDLLRAYAAELVASAPEGERHVARVRLFDYYAHNARNAMADAFPVRRPTVGLPTAAPAPSGTGMTWLRIERPNLLATAQESPAHAIALSATLAAFLDSGAHYDDALGLHELARRAATDAGDLSAEADALDRLGTIRRRRGDYTAAMADHRRSAALFEQAADPAGLGRALQNLGIISWRTGRYREASEHLDRALALHRQTGDRRAEGGALYSLGIVHRRLGDYQQAVHDHQQALAILEQIGDPTGVGKALNNLAFVHLRLGDYAQTEALLERALTIERELHDRAGQGAVLTNLGLTYERMGRYDKAISVLGDALALTDEIDYPVGTADALRALGVVNGRLGRYDEGERLLRSALALGRKLDEGDVQTGALNELGELLLDAGRARDAIACLDEALARATEAGDRFERGRAQLGMARAVGDDRERANAMSLFAELGIPPPAAGSASMTPR